MKNVVEGLLRHVQEGDLDQLKLFINENYRCDDSGQLNAQWASVHHRKSGDTVQIVASRFGHVHILQWLQNQNIDLSQSNFSGKHPLHEAAQHSHVECVRYLLEHGATVDCIKQADWTPLMLACTKNNLDVVMVLVEKLSDLRLQNKDGWTCFHIAVREGHPPIVSYLLDQDSNLWNTRSNNGRTPLHTAALHGKLAITEILLTRGGYSVDERDCCGSTPLMDAILNDHRSVAELLQGRCATRLDTENKLGRQALHQAAQTGNVGALRYLVADKGVAVDVTSSGGSRVTPLHMAAKECQQEAIRVLLELGANTQITDSRGRTPLHIAAGVQDVNCVCLLLDRGATDCKDISGKFARDLACSVTVKDLFDKYTS